MSLNPVKIFEVKAAITRPARNRYTFLYNLEKDYFDISSGIWNIAVKDISYLSSYPYELNHREKKDESGRSINIWFEKYFDISVNFVQGQYNQDLHREFIPLAKFKYKEWGTELINFYPCWFEVNCPSRNFQVNISLTNPGNSSPAIVLHDFEFTLVFMFQRVK